MAPPISRSPITVMSGEQTIIGGSVSFTVTVNVQLAVFPEASVAVQVTVVVPTGKKDPDSGEHDVVTEQLSETSGSE